MKNTEQSFGRLILLVSVLCTLTAFLLRTSTISEGLPYFYDEDEAHHYNRVVNMAKANTLNPEYFHKPSLHFYLRLPVLWAAVKWSEQQGYLTSVKDIVTEDPYGVGDYAFSASHPGIVKWLRAVTLFFGLLLVALTPIVSYQISGSIIAAAVSGTLVAVSPELIRHSSTIGVDTLMSAFCLLSIWLAQKLNQKFSISRLGLLGLTCGLAISCKYNAAPIAVLPALVCLLHKRFAPRELAFALLTPIIGFLAASPYILIRFSLFCEQLVYEVKHYAILGHVGHSGEPGLGQILFYSSWFADQALGRPAALLGLLGIVLLVFESLERNRKAIIFLAFPALFFLLMIAQKVNFTRNMIVLIPCVAICAGHFIHRFSRSLSSLPTFIGVALLGFAIVQPLIQGLRYSADIRDIPESRIFAEQWIRGRSPEDRIAVAGQLQFVNAIYRQPNVQRVNEDKVSPAELALQGYRYFVAGPGYEFVDGVLIPTKYVRGVTERERIVKNPEVRMFQLPTTLFGQPDIRQYAENNFSIPFAKAAAGSDLRCSRATGDEDYCWLQSKLGVIDLAAALPRGGRVRIELLTPWPNQEIQFFVDPLKPLKQLKFSETTIGNWQTVEFPVPAGLAGHTKLYVSASQVLSPKAQGSSGDDRYLALAFRKIELIK